MATFRYLDDLLGSTLDKLRGSEGFLFTAQVEDVSPAQRKLLGDYLAQFRHVMRRFLDAHGMIVERPRISSAWAFRTALSVAQTAVEELNPDSLRGYGELATGGEDEIRSLMADLGVILKQMDSCLVMKGDIDVGERLARLESDAREIVLLRELAEIVTRYGLVEFHSTLMWLADRLEKSNLEIAFFGRVSSGKSSLINWLLGAKILPTGVTPVTTVPTWIVPSASGRATVYFSGEKAVVVELDRLPEFVSEEGNPYNQKNVIRVVVEFPSPRLSQGVCLVDTPGLGSLATAGAAQTLAYLPRCDVGVLLIDSAAGLGEEDIGVARDLMAAGTDLLAILSRADLLASSDREKMHAYLQTQFIARLRVVLPVWPVSVIDGSSSLAERWMDQMLSPRLNSHRELAASSLLRKIEALRDAVKNTLGQLAAAPQARGKSGIRSGQIVQISQTRAVIQSARFEVMTYGGDLQEILNTLIDRAAISLALAWSMNGMPQPETVSDPLAESIQQWGVDLAMLLDKVRNRVELNLENLAKSFPETAGLSELPYTMSLPLFDASGLVRMLVLKRPFCGLLGSRIRHHLARSRMERELTARLEKALRIYKQTLQAWGQDYLAVLEHAFSSAVSPVEAGYRATADHWDKETIVKDLDRLSETG